MHADVVSAVRPPGEGVAYAELHCLSNFSFLQGASHPEELVARAAELGYRALAVTDRNTLAGVVRAHTAARQHGLHLLIGAEVWPSDAPPIVLLAPDRRAYGQLARLLTRGKLRTVKGDCAVSFADISELAARAGWIGIALCSQYAVRAARWKDFDQHLLRYRNVLGAERMYLELALTRDTVCDADWIEEVSGLAQAAGVPLVATNDVHYHVPQRRYLQDVLTAVRHRCTVTSAGGRLLPNAERSLRPLAEIAARYASVREAVARTVEIADRCRFSLDELRYQYPHEVVPKQCTAMQFLELLTWRTACGRYPAGSRGAEPADRPRRRGVDERIAYWRARAEGLPAKVRGMLDSELRLIAELGYEHYFLTVYDLCRYARGRGILCQGRGSAANSAVCYCLGITAVDPARIDLLFERFISRERNEPPDIDVDFEHERREEVFQYIYRKYGRERAAITAEVISYRRRSAVRDIGKALGLSLDCVDTLAKSLDWYDQQPLGDEVLRQAGIDPRDRTIRMLSRLVRQLVGFPRHLSQHVGGFVITESPLCEIVPLENGAMPDRTFIEWDKDDIDALGILKVDCLALGMLTAIRKCFGLLEQQKGTRERGSEGARKTPSGHLRPVHCGGGDEDGADLSGSDRLAEGDQPLQNNISADAAASGYRTIRPGQPDASCSRVRAEQHRGRQCTRDDTRLPAVSGAGQGIAGRAGDPVDHLPGTRSSAEGQRPGAVAGVAGGSQDSARVDQQSSRQALNSREGGEVLCPRSLAPSFPRSLHEIPPEDPVVYDMVSAADTVGVFQIESRAQMSMLPRLRPRCFYDLVIEVAIVRPGPIQGGMVHPYLRRRDGIEPVSYPSEDVRDVLAKTLGVPLFQEQVMRLAVVAAGFTPGEADQLRRAMAAWRKTGSIGKFQERLIRGMLRRGYRKQFAEQVFRQIEGFGEYGFPESHAASFALLVYASAWLKRYHPAAWCGAMINAYPLGFYTPGQLVRDARQHGVCVQPVDVNHSDWDCRLETPPNDHVPVQRPETGASYAAEPGSPALRLGMRVVRGLSIEKVEPVLRACEDLRRQRPARPVRMVRDLARADGVTRDALLRLAAADAFRSCGLSRRAALWEILALDRERGRSLAVIGRQQSLFAELVPEEPAVVLPDPAPEEKLSQDYEAVGFSLEGHPLDLVRPQLDELHRQRGRRGSAVRAPLVRNAVLTRMPDRSPVAVAGLVTCRQRPGTAGGILFITLEDETALANLVIRQNVYERYRAIARTRIALIAEGRVERNGRVIHVMVEHFHDLSALVGRLRHASRDFR